MLHNVKNVGCGERYETQQLYNVTTFVQHAARIQGSFYTQLLSLYRILSNILHADRSAGLLAVVVLAELLVAAVWLSLSV